MADKSLDAQQTGLLKGVRKRLFLQRLRSSLSTIILLVSSAIFIFLLIDVSEGDVIGIDHFAYRLFVVHLRTPLLTEIMEGFSGLASPVTVIVMLIVVAAFAPGPSVGRLASINLGGVVIVDLIFKAIVQRPRPAGFRLVVEKDKLQRWIWCGLFSGVIIMIGVSRIYLGVHYATDVIGGFSLALVWLVLFTKLMIPSLIYKKKVPQAKTD